VLTIKILILLVLCSIFVQDIIGRSVYWIWFPVLTAMLIALRLLQHGHITELWQPVLINLLFLGLQLLIVSVWFSLKSGQWVNITLKFIGWGDLLFLATIAFYLSVLNFLFFYIGSLIVVLILWIGIRFFISSEDKHIPLAGLQALLLAMFLSSDWWIARVNITDDYWLQKLLIR